MSLKDKSLYGHTAFGFNRVEPTIPTELQKLQSIYGDCLKLKTAEELALETDPNGKNLNEPGAKGDAGKVRPALVLGGFARALLAVAQIGTDGAKKYTENGWVSVPNGIDRYDDAKMRHWLKEKAGQELDPDTECLHAAHEAWGALARLDLMLREKESKK
jgi:hypothetical protein